MKSSLQKIRQLCTAHVDPPCFVQNCRSINNRYYVNCLMSYQKLFELTLLATDSGVPQLSSNFTFRIEVQDVNDHTPLFDLEDYDLSLPENSKVNSKIFWLKATDDDVGENARVEYRITSGDNRTFGIFPDGHLFLKMAVDREERDYYSLGVTASDRGVPQRSSTTTMTIHITDKNDNSPEFSDRAYAFFMNENEQEECKEIV